MAAEGPYSCVSLLSAEMLEGTVPTRPASEKVPAVHGKIERRPVDWHKGVECYKRMLVAEPNPRLLTGTLAVQSTMRATARGLRLLSGARRGRTGVYECDV